MVQAIASDLQQADLFIQLLGPLNPPRPAGMSTPKLQFELAQAAKLPIIQWRDETLKPEQIANTVQCTLLQAPTVVATDIKEFKQYIIQRLQDLADAKREAQQGSQHTIQNTGSFGQFVFVDTTSSDIEVATQIAQILQEQGLITSLPLLEGISVAERFADLEGNLCDCDAVILVYRDAPIQWIREQLRYCIKMQSKRDKPHKLIAVCQHTSGGQPPVGMAMPNLKLFDCNQLQAETCIPTLLHALQT